MVHSGAVGEYCALGLSTWLEWGGARKESSRFMCVVHCMDEIKGLPRLRRLAGGAVWRRFSTRAVLAVWMDVVGLLHAAVKWGLVPLAQRLWGVHPL